MHNPISSFKRKFDGSTKREHPWQGDLVDAIGDRWLVVYFERPGYAAGDPRVEVEHALSYSGMDVPLSIFVSFDVEGRLVEYQCDASLTSELSGREISFVDLDLDLIVRPGGMAFERDYDDFAQNRAAMGYTKEAVTAAYAGLRLAHELYDRRECPFDGSAEQLLGRVIASRGPL